MVFQFFKSIVEDNHKLSIKYVSPCLVIEKAGPYLPRNTALHSSLSSAVAQSPISSQRNVSEVTCVPGSSSSLSLPGLDEQQPPTMQTEIVALKNGREA